QQGVPSDDHSLLSLPGGGRQPCPGPHLSCNGLLASCGPRMGVLLVPQGQIRPSLPKRREPVSQLQISIRRRRRPCWTSPPVGDMPPCSCRGLSLNPLSGGQLLPGGLESSLGPQTPHLLLQEGHKLASRASVSLPLLRKKGEHVTAVAEDSNTCDSLQGHLLA
uniref:Uncharacterized protein n=1 Tax=Varanus komodoensis TaxID=61221 RepID=A0A8D2KZ92_VARKO